VAEKTTSAYQQEFRSFFMALNDNPDYNAWMDIYTKIGVLGTGNEEKRQPRNAGSICHAKAGSQQRIF
jgi:hypothetical protein